MELLHAIQAFREWLGPRKLSAATLRAYDQDLRVISDGLALSAGRTVDELRLEEISIPEIRSAFASYAQDHSRSSILRVHSTWNQFFDFLVADGKVAGNPMAAVNRPKTDQRAPKPLEGWADDTVPMLLRSLTPDSAKTSNTRDGWPERDLAIVATLLATGTRSSELLQMNLSSLAGGRGEQVIHVVGKGDKPRSVPVEPQLDELLGIYLETRKQRFVNWKPKADDPLFVGTRLGKSDHNHQNQRSGGKRMTSNQLYYLLKRCLGEAGLANRRPRGAMAHAFRHTFGTTLAAQGAPVAAIRKLMGHSSITTSQGYIDSLAREERNVAAQNRVYDVLRGLLEDER